jgi:hypothetical protein
MPLKKEVKGRDKWWSSPPVITAWAALLVPTVTLTAAILTALLTPLGPWIVKKLNGPEGQAELSTRDLRVVAGELKEDVLSSGQLIYYFDIDLVVGKKGSPGLRSCRGQYLAAMTERADPSYRDGRRIEYEFAEGRNAEKQMTFPFIASYPVPKTGYFRVICDEAVTSWQQFQFPEVKYKGPLKD